MSNTEQAEIQRLTQQLDEYRIAYNRVATAARSLIQPLRIVGDSTSWKDGDETDRVYAWYEMLPLVEALDADIHIGLDAL